MGKINQGLLGPVSGKVGNVIGANWRGINYLRIVPASVKDPKTPSQLDQRSKLYVVLKFLQPLLSFLRKGFRSFGIRMSAFNAAMSYNMRNAIAGESPDFVVDYEKAMVSRGNLRGITGADCVSPEERKIVVTWEDNSGLGNANENDAAVIVVYNPDLNDMSYNLLSGQRGDEYGEILVPAAYSGTEVYVYILFTLEGNPLGTRDCVSNSLYVDKIMVM